VEPLDLIEGLASVLFRVATATLHLWRGDGTDEF
jgi:hypothetical protein